MILRVFRILSFLRILREERDRYRDLARGGATGESDLPASSNDARGCVDRCHGRHHIAPGLFGCANCGAEWSG